MILRVTPGLLVSAVVCGVCPAAASDDPRSMRPDELNLPAAASRDAEVAPPSPTAPPRPAQLAAPASYSVQSLRGRGIDPELMKNLDRQNRFPAGDSLVDIRVNGDFKGAFSVHFNRHGELCFTPVLFRQLGLAIPDGAAQHAEQQGDGACYDWGAQDKRISIRYQTDVLAVSIVVPQQALSVDDGRLRGEEGGYAAVVNYNAFSAFNHRPGANSQYSYLSLQSGFNLHNWLLRSRQQFQQNEAGEIRSETSSLYVQRFLPALNKIVQAGELTVANSLFQLGDLTGMQLTPDSARRDDNGSGVTVNGIANTAQARVEVRQYGMLIFSSLVPAGAFSLDNIPLKNRNGDLDVTVVETDGSQHQFVVAAGMLGRGVVAAAEGFSLALGKLDDRYRDNTGAAAPAPLLLTLSQQWQPATWLSTQGGVLAAEKYQSLALSATVAPAPGMMLATQLVAAQDSYNHIRSSQLSLSGSYQLTQTLSLAGSVSKSTPGFASIGEAQQRDQQSFSNDNSQYGLSLGWSPWQLGTFSVSHSESRRFGWPGQYRYDSLNWSRRLGKALIGVNASRGQGYQSANRQLSVNLSLPLGSERLNNYYRSANGDGRVGSELSGALGKDAYYRLSADRDVASHQQSFNGGINANLHYTSLNMAAASNHHNTQNYSLGMNGGLALHADGVTFSPYAIGDTFGIIELSKKIAGIEIATPGGKVWTDFSGRAIAPAITPWHKNAFDMNTESLPKNIDVANGHRDATLARGTVKKLSFTMISSNRLLLKVALASGAPLPRGSRIRDEQQNFIAGAVDDGVLFLSNAAPQGTLYAEIAGTDRRCKFSYVSSGEGKPNVLYEEIHLKCL